MVARDADESSMSEGSGGRWRKRVQEGIPPITWNADEGRFEIILKGLRLEALENPEKVGVHIQVQPPHLYDVRIREKGQSNWGIGFLTPLTASGFVGLKDNTEYEVRTVALTVSSGKIKPVEDPRIHTFFSGGDE